jgi:uncharacterized protein YkwD
MFPAFKLLLALQLALAAPRSEATKREDIAPQSSHPQLAPVLSLKYAVRAERELFELANAERLRAGLLPLKLDDGLVRAARHHAAQMAQQNQLSHQFSGEPPLIDRIASASRVQLERAGENVAVAASADQAHQALMSSLPHRDNLMSPNFNIAGFGVVEDGARLFVAEDFGASVVTYSTKQADQLVARSIEQLRTELNLPRLKQVRDRNTHSGACAMAEADSLSAAASIGGSLVLSYASMDPKTLPAKVSPVIARRGLHAYSAGSCYARTESYPNGAYWVLLASLLLSRIAIA